MTRDTCHLSDDFFVLVSVLQYTYFKYSVSHVCRVCNRPGVARDILQTPPWFINWLSESPSSSKPSKLHYTRTVRARELKFCENVLPPPRVTCQLSRVRCPRSGVTCPVSHVIFVVFFRQGGGGSWSRFCYHRGIPCWLCDVRNIVLFLDFKKGKI